MLFLLVVAFLVSGYSELIRGVDESVMQYSPLEANWYREMHRNLQSKRGSMVPTITKTTTFNLDPNDTSLPVCTCTCLCNLPDVPTMAPTNLPTSAPTKAPVSPSPSPTEKPTPSPTTSEPTTAPTSTPTGRPSSVIAIIVPPGIPLPPSLPPRLSTRTLAEQRDVEEQSQLPSLRK